ncbi:MAG: cysteine dioxygenase family protein [Deltaproteobacteria bacterium]|nr:cysteine dioxygenase family protein [Deltaproteobacteria bacterium]
MSRLPESLHELQTIFDRWSESIQNHKDMEKRIFFIGKEMPALLLNRQLFKKILTNIVKGRNYPDARQATMFTNEFVLYINNRRLFSVRLYIYEPGQYSPIHDHNSWGVYGCVLNTIEVVRYRREDDETRPEYARLQEIERPILQPGETASVLPLNDGIHRAGNPAGNTSVMLSVYGTPIRRLFVNEYDHIQNRVSKLYPPRLNKKMLASQALETMENP